jgi:hypothetical protein
LGCARRYVRFPTSPTRQRVNSRADPRSNRCRVGLVGAIQP